MSDQEHLSRNDNVMPELESLQRETEVPVELEERVIATLRKHHLIRSRGRRAYRLLLTAATAAAAIVIFFAGVFFERSRIASPKSAVTMSDRTYILFLREGPEYRQAQNESEMYQRVESYRNWAINLRQKGVPISGTKLRDEANFLNSTRAETDPVGGYFLIDADSEQQALRIARSCPHIKYGGSIEVRRIHPV